MHVGIDPTKAPLARYESSHLKLIKMKELTESLKKRGVELISGGDSSVKLSLRNLISCAGTLQRARVELMSVLRELGADAVSLEPADLEYLGGRDVFTHTAARGLEAGVPELEALLLDIPVDDDPEEPTIDIFGRIDQANVFIANDVHPNLEVHERLQRGAERDLFANRLLPDDSREDYRGFLEPRVAAEAPPVPQDFQVEAKPYRSIFDTQGE